MHVLLHNVFHSENVLCIGCNGPYTNGPYTKVTGFPLTECSHETRVCVEKLWRSARVWLLPPTRHARCLYRGNRIFTRVRALSSPHWHFEGRLLQVKSLYVLPPVCRLGGGFMIGGRVSRMIAQSLIWAAVLVTHPQESDRGKVEWVLDKGVRNGVAQMDYVGVRKRFFCSLVRALVCRVGILPARMADSVKTKQHSRENWISFVDNRPSLCSLVVDVAQHIKVSQRGWEKEGLLRETRPHIIIRILGIRCGAQRSLEPTLPFVVIVVGNVGREEKVVRVQKEERLAQRCQFK